MEKRKPDWNAIFQTVAGGVSGAAGAYAASQYEPAPSSLNVPVLLVGAAGVVALGAALMRRR